MSARLHHKTPTINAIDSRSLPVRQVAYCRLKADEKPEVRITSRHHDTAGRQVAQWDPRLSGKAPKANLTTVYSLSGKVLLVDSVDAGWRASLPGDAGQILHNWDPRGSHWQTTYDDQIRPTAVQEKSPESPPRIIERFSYGDSSSESAALNLCGALTRHDDSAGTLLIDEYALCAKPLSQTRHFLLGTERPNWPADQQQRDVLHEAGDGYKTTWDYDTQGEIIRQIDARQHQQRFSFDVAGQLKSVSLKIKDAAIEKTIVKDLVYNAFNQVESQTAGNGVVSRAVFDPASGRLTSLSASASASTLQDLHYTYDAVGNVTKIEDKAQPVQFGSNQRVEAVSTFTYNSLYQLISATGREAAGQNSQPRLPLSSRTPVDARQLFNFTEHYQYDTGGNLTELRHIRDRNNYTRTLNVSTASNRLLSWNKGDSTPDVTASFDANGNQQALYAGQALEWNIRNQLGSVMLIQRDNGRDDIERYCYDGSGQRVRKIQTTYAATVTHSRETRYLPGLEISTRNNEHLEVITLQAGRCSVRYLHWTQGRPSGISTNQLRYSLDDHLGSSSLELDDQAWLISQESYLPYGGTAWTASRSEVEADYKTIRYSGKERDASGLYYYGHRYYAPWLQRWVSADPAGTADGLNLYCMVGNNPVRFVDHQGLVKDDVIDAMKSHGNSRSKRMMDTTSAEPANDGGFGPHPGFSKKKRNELLVHSYGVVLDHTGDDDIGLSEYHNLTGPKSGPTGYRGVDKDYVGSAKSEGFYLNFGSYRIGNTADYMADLASRYSATKKDRIHGVEIDSEVLRLEPTLSRTVEQMHELQQSTRDFIEKHIENSNQIIPIRTGGPGAHGEVRLLNSVVALFPGQAERVLSDTYIFTEKLLGTAGPEPFIACPNCSGSIPAAVTIPTDRVVLDYEAYNSFVERINLSTT